MSCIDLIFCSNQNTPIFDKCHHNIICGKSDIHVPLPPKYVREVWDYSKAGVQNIKKSIKDFYWGKSLESFSIDSKVDLLNETLLNIFQNIFQIKKSNVTIVSLHG